jgi:DNA modification methylase
MNKSIKEENQIVQNFKKNLDSAKLEKRLGMHSFHRYYGKLIPAIPRTAIRMFTKTNDLVFDPFSGSGTTSLEAKFFNRDFLGLEINPLSVQISKVKTNNYNPMILTNISSLLEEKCREDKKPVSEKEIPFCINRDHWFKDFVQRDMVIISRNIQKSVSTYVDKNEEEQYVLFFQCVLSAIVKQVSNADTATVFPGISKRVRKLEAEGKIHKDVFATYFRGVKKRIGYVKELSGCAKIPSFLICDSSNIDLSEYKGKASLIVTNPPYISSVRYAETLKLELYWMGIVKNSQEYTKLQESMIGNDKYAKSSYEAIHYTKYDFINKEIDYMFNIDKKDARVLFDFFSMMEKVIIRCSVVLRSGGKLVMKISDSKIRKHAIHTGYYLTKIAENYGFKFVGMFNDKINEHSRSLLTARNTYSDIILEDNILIWEKL